MAASSLRCVAFAYRPHDMAEVPNEDQRDDWKLPEDNLIILGIVGIKVLMKFWVFASSILNYSK
jgi:P-type Ca2+ transporter type 2C